jgi:hypothetical protein
VTTISKKKAGEAKPQDGAGNKKRKRKEGKGDDAPRAFKRLMALAEGKKLRSGLDDGVVLTKKQKKANAAAKDNGEPETVVEEEKRTLPTIRPGERLSEFAHRVDSELPLGGLVKKTVKNGKDPLGAKVWRTKKEMKMHKLYDEWRLQDQKIKERKAEEQELAEDREIEEEEATGVSWKTIEASTGGRKKKKRVKDDDPWAELAKKRGEAERSGRRDVVKAPPELKAPTNKLVRGAAVKVTNVPKAAGSLRQREELAELRDDVVASYRKLMSAKRATHSIGEE